MDNMQFEIYIKEGDAYKKYVLSPQANEGWQWIKSLKLTVDQQLDKLRDDIISVFPKNAEINLIKPTIDDYEKQKKLDVLAGIRKVNNKTKDILIGLLSDEQFVICENCGGNMYRIPLGVNMDKYGNKFIIKDIQLHTNIQYIYACENCVFATSATALEEIRRNLDLRKKLLDAGESFVPGKFGFWHWVNDKKKTKPSIFYEDKQECDHAWKRTFEHIDLDVNRKFVKIKEVCVKCGKTGFCK